jgi:hypothetical protein
MNAALESKAMAGRAPSRDDLLRAGRSLKLLAITVILLLSAGVGVMAFQQWLESGALAQTLRTRGDLVMGFGLLMILTVGYLVGKGMSTARMQRTMMAELLEQESITRARHLDPILEFHHPELCREILLRQANYACRIGSPISLVELTVPELPKKALDEETRPAVEEFYQEMRRQCRPLDFWVRWTPHSFLLVLLDITPEETAGVLYRLRARLVQWWEQRTDVAWQPSFEWRYRTVGTLGASGDILREVAGLMQPDQFVATPMADVWQSREPMPLESASSRVGRRSR